MRIYVFLEEMFIFSRLRFSVFFFNIYVFFSFMINEVTIYMYLIVYLCLDRYIISPLYFINRNVCMDKNNDDIFRIKQVIFAGI